MNNLKYYYQLQLQWIGQDEKAGYALFMGNQYAEIVTSHQQWQTALDFVIRCTLAGLIEDPYNILPENPWESAQLLAIEPIDMNETEKMLKQTWYWSAVQFFPTKLLKQLLLKYDLDSWQSPINISFIESIENKFIECGVPFRDEPLVKISPP